jgi:hypothetical protein
MIGTRALLNGTFGREAARERDRAALLTKLDEALHGQARTA